ncbi:hypothetical protein [Frigidibacter sp. MR17.24]|uniref:hypothetical protein n=1 Tax=Frigidibacter sp. MR17.24 TaxID=3127345 RepID=UPI0030129CFD
MPPFPSLIRRFTLLAAIALVAPAALAPAARAQAEGDGSDANDAMGMTREAYKARRNGIARSTLGTIVGLEGRTVFSSDGVVLGVVDTVTDLPDRTRRLSIISEAPGVGTGGRFDLVVPQDFRPRANIDLHMTLAEARAAF